MVVFIIVLFVAFVSYGVYEERQRIIQNRKVREAKRAMKEVSGYDTHIIENAFNDLIDVGYKVPTSDQVLQKINQLKK